MADEPILANVSDSWFGHLIVILLSYATVFVPGYILIRLFYNMKYIEKAGTGLVDRLIVACVYGHDSERFNFEEETTPKPSPTDKGPSSSFSKLILCFGGLQVSYLTWGILQEKIMTKEYQNASGDIGHFKDSQFLVFINRILAFLLAATYIIVSRQPRHTAPLYKYSYCSFSNIMSSWCQYEALKYVSFPTQVLAKASKIIPTMIMGKVVSGKKYEYFEYFTAILISVGMTMFLLGSTEDKGSAGATTLSGVIILIGYMTFDAFTSNWQGELFNVHKMSSIQMMCGVNLFSCLLTSVSLLQQGAFNVSFSFMLTYPSFLVDCIILSICSASGQLFIFYTIACFGPVIFIIIMTIRQGLAILLSCIIYSHPISAIGIMGITVVFLAIFLRIYCNHRLKQVKPRRATAEINKG